MRCKACNIEDAKRYKGGEYYCGECSNSIRQSLLELKYSNPLVEEKRKEKDV
jgi:ribosomal protein L37AE/L43A